MNKQQLKDEILFKLTGGLLNCELDDKSLDMLINHSMRELQRYYDSTKLITIPYQRCIDLSQYKVNAVARIYRAAGFTNSNDDVTGEVTTDPIQVSQWQLLSGGGNLYNFQNFSYDYQSWNTLLQIRNTTSTDLKFRFDKDSEKLYINTSSGFPDTITIEYVPRLDDVTEIKTDFWIDVLTRMCVAEAKIALGRIRTRYSQSGALWAGDGEKILEEGNSELSALREQLLASTQLCYPID